MDTLHERRVKHVATQMHSFVHRLSPETCSNMFTPMAAYHNRNTRSKDTLILAIPRMNLSIGQRNICYFGVKIWKKVPDHLNTTENLDSFKNDLKRLNIL